MRHLPFLLLFLLAFLSCKKQESGTQSSSAGPNLSGNSCYIGKWPSTPVTLKMSSEFTGDYTNVDIVGGLNPLEQMAKVWNTATTPTTLINLPFPQTATTGFSSLSSFRDNEIGIYKSHTWFSGVSSSALAITQFYGIVKSDPNLLGTYIELTHADIIFNYRDFNSQFNFNGGAFYYDVPTVLLHEMGHLLGLCHESVQSSIMAPNYATKQRALQDFDSRKIKALYVDNMNITAMSTNGISAAPGTEVKGFVELNSNGKCRHFINGKMVYEHTSAVNSLPAPKWYKNLPLR